MLNLSWVLFSFLFSGIHALNNPSFLSVTGNGCATPHSILSLRSRTRLALLPTTTTRSIRQTILFSADEDEDKLDVTADDATAYAEAALKAAEEALAAVDDDSMDLESLTQLSNNTSSPLQSKAKSSDGNDEKSTPLKQTESLAVSGGNETFNEPQKEMIDADLSGEDALEKVKMLAKGEIDGATLKSELKQRETEVKSEMKQREAEVTKSGATDAAIAAATIGLISGVVFDATVIPYDIDLQFLPPTALGATFGASTFFGANREGGVAGLLRKILGGTTRAVGKAIGSLVRNSVDSAVSSVKAVPGKVKGAVVAKVDETVNEVKMVPTKIKAAATDATEKIVEGMKKDSSKI